MSIGCGRIEKQYKEELCEGFISESPEHTIVNDGLPDPTFGTFANAVVWEWNEETGEISGSCDLASGVLDDTNNFVIL